MLGVRSAAGPSHHRSFVTFRPCYLRSVVFLCVRHVSFLLLEARCVSACSSLRLSCWRPFVFLCVRHVSSLLLEARCVSACSSLRLSCWSPFVFLCVRHVSSLLLEARCVSACSQSLVRR